MSKMSQRKETIWNVLIIACVVIILGFLGGFVSGILNLGETAGIIIRTVVLFLLISLGMKLFSHFYTKPLTQEMKEEIREAEYKDEKQMVFKPSVGVIIFFIIFTFLPAFDIIYSLIKNKAEFDLTFSTFSSIFILVIFTWLWYKVPVFIFTENSVQIKSHLFYLLGIDRKTDIRYADITSVSPDAEIKANMWGIEPKHRLLISTDGTTHNFGVGWYNSDLVAKIYLRFKEKRGDKVTMP